MNDEVEEILVPCDICGEPATKYVLDFVVLVCNNPVCYVARLEDMGKFVEQANKILGSSTKCEL